MYAFAVIRNTDQKKGSVVSAPVVIDGEVGVCIMWDDDLTFSCERVQDLTGNPINAPKEQGFEVLTFPGEDGDTTH